LLMPDDTANSSNGIRNLEGGGGQVVPAQDEMQRMKREAIQAVLDIFDGRLIM